MANAWIIKPLPMTVIAATGVTAGAPSHVANDYAGCVWQSEAANGVNIVVDLGADVSVDTIMMFGVSRAPANALMTVYSAVSAYGPGFTGGNFVVDDQAPVYAGAITPRQGGVSIYRPKAVAAGGPGPSRYWKFFFDLLGGQGIQISRIVLGKRIQLARNFGFGAAQGVRDLGSVDYGSLATLLRRRAARLRVLGVTFSSVYRDEVENVVDPLLAAVGATDPIALVTDPDPHANRQQRCWFGPLVPELGHVRRNAVAWEWKASMIDLFPILP